MAVRVCLLYGIFGRVHTGIPKCLTPLVCLVQELQMLSFWKRLTISTTSTHESKADSRNERAVFAQRASRELVETSHCAVMRITSRLLSIGDVRPNNVSIQLFYAFIMPDFAAELTASHRDILRPWCLRPKFSTVPPLNSAANSAVADRHQRDALFCCSSQLDSRPEGHYCLRIATSSLRV